MFTNNNRCCTFCECFFGSECAIPATLCTMYASLRQVRFSASSMLLPVKYASPRQVCFSASSTLLRVKYASSRQVRFSASSMFLCFKYASPCQVTFSMSSTLLHVKNASFTRSGEADSVLLGRGRINGV